MIDTKRTIPGASPAIGSDNAIYKYCKTIGIGSI
jgi:hypothetical protein